MKFFVIIEQRLIKNKEQHSYKFTIVFIKISNLAWIYFNIKICYYLSLTVTAHLTI